MSGTLPTWMEHWFGLSNGSGMGIAWRLDYHWPWPPWATLLGVVVLVAAIVAIYLRETRQAGRGYRLVLAAMRLLALGLVLIMIAQIELFLQRTGLPFVVVIIDDTQSMRTVDRYDDDAAQSAGRSRGGLDGGSRREQRRERPALPVGTSPACSLRKTTASC